MIKGMIAAKRYNIALALVELGVKEDKVLLRQVFEELDREGIATVDELAKMEYYINRDGNKPYYATRKTSSGTTKQISKEIKDEIIELYKEGKTLIKDICIKYGIVDKTLHRWATTAGVIRSRTEAAQVASKLLTYDWVKKPEEEKVQRKQLSPDIRHYMHQTYKQCSYEHCGATKSLEIDNIDGNPANNVISNLQVICRTCHMAKTSYEKKEKAGTLDNQIDIKHRHYDYLYKNRQCVSCPLVLKEKGEMSHTVYYKDGDKFNTVGSNMRTVCYGCHEKIKRGVIIVE